VPGLITSTRMPMFRAIGTSLIVVFVLGLTTALSYAASSLVNWPLAAAFIVGGVAGSSIGALCAKRLSGKRGWLTTAFACLIFTVASYMLGRSLIGLR
jgi:uncharacterized membrane protein YfcA